MMSEFHTEADMVTPALGAAYPFYTTCDEPHACNVIVMSRQAPVSAREEHEVSPTELRVVWTEFEVGGAPLRLVATHLQRPYPTARQAAQRAELLDTLSAGAIDNTILAGDFNATPWSFALRGFDAESGLIRYDRGMPTWPAAAWTRLRLPAPEAFMPIDHIYAGGNWRLVSIRRGPRTGADHYPIEAEFVWASGER
jgi:endonuclease/exonuclease/phosphatase (EEP) superfamily protein YafD